MLSSEKAVLLSIAGLLITSGLRAADLPAAHLSLNPTVITADDESAGAAQEDQGLLMMGLDQLGAGKTLSDAKINIYGWLETGYTYNHRHSGASSGTVIIPGPFNHEWGNHYMINQLDLIIERGVDTAKFDVGGLIELMYGSDAARIHATGLGYNGSDPTDDNSPADGLAVDNLHPILQFDIPQAFVNINLPIGPEGLQVAVGKWISLLGYETIDPTQNAFYSHSYLFSAVPGTQTGILASYQVNKSLGLKLGITRGWEIALEDNNGCAIDVTGQVSWKFTDSFDALVNFNVGPENAGDTGHYRTAINPILNNQVTEHLKLGLEGLYVYDGGYNGNITGFSDGRSHAYGDTWGVAAYAGYKINDMFTLNARVEKAHGVIGTFAGVDLFDGFGTIPALSVYEITLGTTITPFPADKYLKNLIIRPEIRYDFTDSSAFPFFSAHNTTYKDQLTFAADVILKF
ncbi:MAG TPA: outer membrane beta-barrel protein [Phycisphaerae bacterium]|nr:outer membrane beta-barrel protein [Phycisphaerae bacterium]